MRHFSDVKATFALECDARSDPQIFELGALPLHLRNPADRDAGHHGALPSFLEKKKLTVFLHSFS